MINPYKKAQEEYIELALKEAGTKQGKGRYRAGTFYSLAEKYRKEITEEIEIEKDDLTKVFWYELVSMVKEKEQINININGPPTSGKSTAGMEIGWVIDERILPLEFNIMNIDRDQHEYMRKVSDDEMENITRVVDEWSEMEETGENATVIEAYLNYISDVMAQRFIRKISCSPSADADKNANLYLQVISKDEHMKVIHCKVFWKTRGADWSHHQIVGTVSIYVGDVLEKPWYKEYRRRKFEKMQLITREGIFRPRELEYAEAYLTVIDKLKPLTEFSGTSHISLARSLLEQEFRKRKIPQSLVGKRTQLEKVDEVLNAYRGYYKICADVRKLQKEFGIHMQKGELDEADTKKVQLAKMNDAKNEIGRVIDDLRTELKHYVEINKKYNTIQEGRPEIKTRDRGEE